MQTYVVEVAQIVESIWATFLEIGIVPMEPAHARAIEGHGLVGCVHIRGAWHGTVVLHSTAPLARHLTGMIFRIDPAAASPSDIVDALGELTNMTGGNVKALMPEPCTLSLPIVVPTVEHGRQVAGATLIGEVAYECLGEPFRVCVYERETPFAG